VADGQQPETLVKTDTLEELGAKRVEQPAPRKTKYDAPEPGMLNYTSQALEDRWRARWDS
jgi:hypothetical protein